MTPLFYFYWLLQLGDLIASMKVAFPLHIEANPFVNAMPLWGTIIFKLLVVPFITYKCLERLEVVKPEWVIPGALIGCVIASFGLLSNVIVGLLYARA